MSLVEQAIRKLQQERQAATRQAGATGVPAARDEHKPSTAQGEPSAAPVARRTEMPVTNRVLTIDLEALRAQGMLPPRNRERQLAQQYRQIKRPLVAGALARASADASDQLIMIASAMPGEGKTFTSLNLALSMSREKDVRVLLVDADMPKPHVSTVLGVEKERGLLDALRNSALDVESLILPTSVPGFFVLPAGTVCENATELLASDRMREVGQQLAERDPRRIVLFDSSPLLLTTESQALAQLVGQVVIVVRAESTPHKTLLDAIDSLGEGRPVSLILNQSSQRPGADYYYYGTYGSAGSQGSRE